MNTDELSLIRATFARLKRNKTNFGRLFYDRLFAIAPDARPLFKGNLDAQVHKLMDSLAIIIGSASTTIRSAKRCSGLCSRSWATTLRLRCGMPGRRFTYRSRPQ